MIWLILGAGAAGAGLPAPDAQGAKARSMGGAYLGLADDLEAILRNPAGLVFCDRTTIGFSFDAALPRGTYQQWEYFRGGGSLLAVDGRTGNHSYFSGAAAAARPMGNRWIIGLSVSSSPVLGIDWNGSDLTPLSAGRPDIRWSSRFEIATIAPAAAFKINDRLSLGLSLCLNAGRFGFSRYAGNFIIPLPDPPYMGEIDLGQYEENLTGWGAGAVIGILYRPTSRISLGASIRTKSTIRFKGEATVAGFPALGAASGKNIGMKSGIDKNIPFPPEAGLGIAFRPMENLTLAADLCWTRWSDLGEIRTNYRDPDWNVFMGERGNDRTALAAKDTVMASLGAEYRIGKLAVRAGCFRDSSTGTEDGALILSPGQTSLGASAGMSFSVSGWRIEGGVEIRRPWKRREEVSFISFDPPSSRTIWEFWLPGRFEETSVTAGLSLTYRF